MHDETASRPIRVSVVVLDGVTLFEMAAACDVFGTDAATNGGYPLYQVSLCGPKTTVITEAGFTMEVPSGLDTLREADTIVVPPIMTPGYPVPAAVLDALRQASADGKRVLSLCTGAFILAAAGLLDGRSATTHWSECAQLAQQYPRVRVDPGVLYVDEGDVLTSAGSAASLDLCLHVVQRDYGTEVAAKVARDLVLPLHRPGGQAQYIETPMPPLVDADIFSETLTWLVEHLDEPVTVADLAGRAAMSSRTFARRFLASTGTTPLRWILQERLRLAQRLLEMTDLPVDAVAHKSGFGSADNLRKHFSRVVRTTPQAYRRAFHDLPAEQAVLGVTPAGGRDWRPGRKVGGRIQRQAQTGCS